MPDLLKDRDQPRCYQMLMVSVNLLQWIKGDRMIKIRRIEIDRLIDPSFRDEVEQILSQIAVRINQSQAISLWISEMTIFLIKVDLPVPVLPMMYMCPLLFFSLIPNLFLMSR